MPEILKLILNSLLFFCLVACNEGSDMVLLLNEVTKRVYFIGNERMLIDHDSNRLRFS